MDRTPRREPFLSALFALVLSACSGSASDGRSGSLDAEDAGPDGSLVAEPEPQLDAAPGDTAEDSAVPVDEAFDAAFDAAFEDAAFEDAALDASDGDTDSAIDEGGPCVGAPDLALCQAQLAAISGLRAELVCTEPVGNRECTNDLGGPTRATMPGATDTLYRVTFRLRGVVEPVRYNDQTGSPLPTVSGTTQLVENPVLGNDLRNEFTLAIADPPVLLALNNGEPIPACELLDVYYPTRIRGGAELTLSARTPDSFQQLNEDSNRTPIVVPEVAPAPEPFDGQFVQLDVVSLGVVSP